MDIYIRRSLTYKIINNNSEHHIYTNTIIVSVLCASDNENVNAKNCMIMKAKNKMSEHTWPVPARVL